MNSVVTEIVEAARDVVRIAFVDPVKEGRPRPSQWPVGMRPVGIAAVVVVALLILATLLATPLRRWDVLVVNPVTSQALPSLSIPLLLTAVVLSFAMALTAAIHTSWWLRLTLLVIGAMAAVMFTFTAAVNPIQLVVGALGGVALVVFIGVRAFGAPTWWEFPVVLALLTITLILPWGMPGILTFGSDLRMTAIEGGFGALMPLMLPAIMVAGFAPAQVVVTAAQAIADRPVSRGLFWTVFGLALAGLIAATVVELSGDNAPTLSGLWLSALRLAAVAAVTALLLVLAKTRRPPAPAAFPEAWSTWVYPVSAAITGMLVLSFAVSILTVLGSALGGISDATAAFYYAFTEGDFVSYYRVGIALVGLVLAWRFARRDRLTEAIMLGTFAVMSANGALSQVPTFSFLAVGAVENMGLIAAGIALVAGLVHLVRGRFDRGRATGVLTVVTLALLYPYRDALSDPISTALAVAPVAMVVFGLLWRVATEAQVTYGSSRRYPSSTRILLFMANSLLATTGIAFISLSRGTGTVNDTTMWAGVGDSMLGQPLYVAGLVAALWLLLRPHDRGEALEPLTDEAYDPVEAAEADAAMAWTPPTSEPVEPAEAPPPTWWPPPPTAPPPTYPPPPPPLYPPPPPPPHGGSGHSPGPDSAGW